MSNQYIIAIGVSTGGPSALEEILPELAADFPAPIIIVQHMPAKFTARLAERLHQLCKIRVVEAQNGARIENGTAYITPGGMHLEVTPQFTIRILQPKEGDQFVPCIDTTFSSIARNAERKKILGIILTGMCKDGVLGLKEIKDKGGITIAQDRTTSVVFGMPKAAIELGCVDYVLPLRRIAGKITEIVKGAK